MINRKQLGLRIREARQQKGMSQQELAAVIGVSDKTISAYEVGRVDPPLDALEKLSQATSHPIGFFVGDVQSNIEARLDRIASELSQIRETLTSEVNHSVSPAPSASTATSEGSSEEPSAL